MAAAAENRRPSGSPLCQEGAVATRSLRVAWLAAGPGSDLSEVLAIGDRSAALDFVAAPECPPGPAALRSAAAANVRQVRGEDGTELAVARFESTDVIDAWREQPDHVRARERGREEFFASYEITIATVHKQYGWSRDN